MVMTSEPLGPCTEFLTDAEDFLVAPGSPVLELLPEVKPTQPEPARTKKQGQSLHELLFDGEPAPKVNTDPKLQQLK